MKNGQIGLRLDVRSVLISIFAKIILYVCEDSIYYNKQRLSSQP